MKNIHYYQCFHECDLEYDLMKDSKVYHINRQFVYNSLNKYERDFNKKQQR